MCILLGITYFISVSASVKLCKSAFSVETDFYIFTEYVSCWAFIVLKEDEMFAKDLQILVRICEINSRQWNMREQIWLFLSPNGRMGLYSHTWLNHLCSMSSHLRANGLDTPCVSGQAWETRWNPLKQRNLKGFSIVLVASTIQTFFESLFISVRYMASKAKTPWHGSVSWQALSPQSAQLHSWMSFASVSLDWSRDSSPTSPSNIQRRGESSDCIQWCCL